MCFYLIFSFLGFRLFEGRDDFEFSNFMWLDREREIASHNKKSFQKSLNTQQKKLSSLTRNCSLPTFTSNETITNLTQYELFQKESNFSKSRFDVFISGLNTFYKENFNIKLVFKLFNIKNYFSYKDPIPDVLKLAKPVVILKLRLRNISKRIRSLIFLNIHTPPQ